MTPLADNIVSMFDQLCYLVVFSNQLNMEERITDSKERFDFFMAFGRVKKMHETNLFDSWKEQHIKKKLIKRCDSKIRTSGRIIKGSKSEDGLEEEKEAGNENLTDGNEEEGKEDQEHQDGEVSTSAMTKES